MSELSVPSAVNDLPRTARITVRILGEGKHLFESIRDTRVAVVSNTDEINAPDLVVLPCGQDRRFERLMTTALPDRLRSSILAGSTRVVLDVSPEAIPPKPDIVASLHEVIARLGLFPRQCAYVTANWHFADDYAEHCAARGIHETVRILHYDYWIWNSLARVAENGERVYAERLAAFRSRPHTRPRRFLSLNRTPRPFKIVFLLSLIRDQLWDAGFISFGGFSRPDHPGKPRPTIDQLTAALPGFEDLIAELASRLETLDGYGCVLLGEHRKRLNQQRATEAQELSEYNESWVSAVTETEMQRLPQRITEKVLKPLVNFHPMVLFGNPGSLQRVKEYGFVTFDDVLDESYDQEPDPRRRFDLAYRELVRLCRLSDRELGDLERLTSDRLIFNARWGLTRFPTIYRAQRDRELVDKMLALPRVT